MVTQQQALFEAPVSRRASLPVPSTRLRSPQLRDDARLQAAFHNNPVMRMGERGPAVAKLQQALIDLGFLMPITTRNEASLPDGIFGRETAATVQRFQRRYGLQVDGRVGRQTLGTLDSILATPGPFDVTDDRIDPAAQRALLRLFRAGATSRADAVGMLGAVKIGQLAGIYRDDSPRAAALRARLLQPGPSLLPVGEDAVLVLRPDDLSAPPTIIFRHDIREIPARLDPALRRAWHSFQMKQLGKLVLCPVTPQDASLFAAPSGVVPVGNVVPAILCALPSPALTGPMVEVASRRFATDLPAPRFVGNAPAPPNNVREEVLDTMDRLHLLWSITNTDYGKEYPVASALPLGSAVNPSAIPLTVAAIGRNANPTLSPPVAKHFLNIDLTAAVGRGETNNKSDILRLQVPLRALSMLSDSDFARENAVVSSLTTSTVPDARIRATIDAIALVKVRIAGGRLGWAPIHTDENESGGDRFGGQTFLCDVTGLCHFPKSNGPPPTPARTVVSPFTISIFVPHGAKPDTNKVHVFFSPGGVHGDSGLNATLMHGLRGAADASEWILISVPGIAIGGASGWSTIDMTTITSCLTRVGRGSGIGALRLSAHSRGGGGLKESLLRSFITGPIERIIILDCSEFFQGFSFAALKRRGATVGKVIHYRVNNQQDAPGALVVPLAPGCMRAIGYTRLIQAAMVTRPTLTIPADIRSRLLPLPPRGSFTSWTKPSKAPTNVGAFCRANAKAIGSIIKQENDPTQGLLRFIHDNDVTRMNTRFSAGIYSHHLFVAEIAHEFTD